MKINGRKYRTLMYDTVLMLLTISIHFSQLKRNVEFRKANLITNTAIQKGATSQGIFYFRSILCENHYLVPLLILKVFL